MKNEQRLLQIFGTLSEHDKHSLLKFAEFLFLNREAVVVEEPKQIPVAESETVVGALKRLSESYFMLDKSKMLDETSALMSQHIMMGRKKEDVIAELEQLFAVRYELMKKESETQ